MTGARPRARIDTSLVARVVSRRPLFYARGADPALDRPPHVRAGSSLARLACGRLAVVQDDAAFVAVVDPVSGTIEDVPLPSEDGARLFDDLRGNKAKKLDLEACFALPDGALAAFGSGSSPARDRVVLVERGAARVVHAKDLYAAMRAAVGFSGAELNVEGAALEGEDIVFFQRGNGRGDAVDATARVDARALVAHLRGQGPCPSLREIVRWDLGASPDGVRLTFTDGVAPDGNALGDALAFLACAEASPDATRDGPVSAVAIGILRDRVGMSAIAPILDETGAPLLDKVEGLVVDEGSRRAFLVADRDDPEAPSELLEATLGPGWRASK